jgi:prepilin-type N-terminal cleavage/methylation domain-containing protein
MRWLREQRGFTILELVIVLAITSLMLVAVIAGKGVLFQNSAFTGAMDDAQNTFRQIQNEANQALSINTLGTGQSAEVIFGRLVELTTGSSTLRTWTLVGAEDNTGTVASLAKCDEDDMTLPDGVVYQASNPTYPTKAVVFTRNTAQTATTGQIFVAPDGADDTTQPSNGTPASCPSGGTALPPASSGPDSGALASECDPALGETDTRTGTTDATDTCSSVVPPAPTLTVTDAEGTSATGTALAAGALTTSTAKLPTVTVTLPATPAGSDANETIHLWDGATETTVSVHPTTDNGSASFSFTLPSTGPTENTLTATWVLGSSQESLHSYAVDVTYTAAPPSTCSAAASIAAGYQCGLTGSYYRGSDWGKKGQLPQTVVIDGAGAGKNIGETLGNSAAAYSNFLPTLRTRTGQPIAQTASVNWTGQIYLAAGNQTVCLQSDNTSSNFSIAGSTAVAGNSGPSPAGSGCTTASGGTQGTWSSITINYTHSSSSGEGSASVRLVTATAGAQTADLCAYTEGIQYECDYGVSSQSYISTCQTGTDPPDLPASGGSAIFTCEVSNLSAAVTYTDINGSTLRTTTPAAATAANCADPTSALTNSNYYCGVPPSPQGLTATYLYEYPGGSGDYTAASTATVNGVGTASSPATWPDSTAFLNYLIGKVTPADPGFNITTQHVFDENNGYLQIPQAGYYKFSITGDDAAEFEWIDTGQDAFFTDNGTDAASIGTYESSPAIYATPGQYPIYIGHVELCYCNPNESGVDVTVQRLDSSGHVLQNYGDIPLSWFTTADTYVAAGPAQTQLPGYQQLVENIETTAKKLPDPVANAAPASGLLHRIAQAITPPAAYAAAGDAPNCDDLILDPYNYLNTCSAFAPGGSTSLELEVPGDQTGHIIFNAATGTISWSDH